MTLRVLIGTLHSGENEFDQCVAALRRQSYPHWEQFVLADLPEQEAHERLYARFMECAREFELFLKLDADMVLSAPDKLGAAVRTFEESPSLDHAVFRVHDWMTSTPIIGIHMFRNHVRWPARSNSLFLDSPPIVRGHRRYYIRRAPSPLALHSPDPSLAQAFRYGLHRGLKAFQHGQGRAGLLSAVTHWRLLKRLWRHFNAVRDERLGLALLGVEHAASGAVAPAECDYTHPRFQDLLAEARTMTPDEIHQRLLRRWQVPVRRDYRWARTIMTGVSTNWGRSANSQ
ncbi:MAG: hypothetical protein ACYSTY_07600 [Planctomycetota bacterium]|jgi:hypothetical protein